MNFGAWSDDEVRAWLRMAAADLEKASIEQPETEWHEVCLAATVLLANEAGSRGLTVAP